MSVFEETVFLPPSSSGPNLKQYLKAKLLNTYLGKCNQSTGFVSDISDEITILENKISTTNSGVFYKVRFKANTLQPEVGAEFKGKITTVIAQGIIVVITAQMKVHISTEKLEESGYSYKKESRSFVSDTNEHLKTDVEVSVIIDSVKYDKQTYNCLGHLKPLSEKSQLKKTQRKLK